MARARLFLVDNPCFASGLRQLLFAGAIVLAPAAVLAGPITITNNVETTSAFKTTVDAISGTLLATDHDLVDLPNTPWQSDSHITETAAYLGGADSLQVDWTVQHLQGPHTEDINPGPLVVSGPLVFTATIAGPFAVAFPAVGSALFPHPTTGLPHDDSFIVSISGVVESLPIVPFVVDRLAITSYTITYQAFHLVPEPGSLAIAALGAVLLVVAERKRACRRARNH